MNFFVGYVTICPLQNMLVVSGTYCYKYLHVTCVWAQFVSVCGGYEGRIWGRSPVEVTRARLGPLLVALCSPPAVHQAPACVPSHMSVWQKWFVHRPGAESQALWKPTSRTVSTNFRRKATLQARRCVGPETLV